MTTHVSDILVVEERAALQAAERRARQAREERVALQARRVADGLEPDPATPADELRLIFNEGRRIIALRSALAARRELPALRAAEQAAREAAAARTAELQAAIKKLSDEMADLGRPAHEASQAAQAMAVRARDVVSLLSQAERDQVTALQERIEACRARANGLRRKAQDAPGLLERARLRLSRLAADLARFQRGAEPESYGRGLARAHDEAKAEADRLAALSPSALRAEAEQADREADAAAAELEQVWEKIAADAGPTIEATTPPAKGRRSR